MKTIVLFTSLSIVRWFARQWHMDVNFELWNSLHFSYAIFVRHAIDNASFASLLRGSDMDLIARSHIISLTLQI